MKFLSYIVELILSISFYFTAVIMVMMIMMRHLAIGSQSSENYIIEINEKELL